MLLQATELESAVAEQAQSVTNAETTLKLKELEFERRAIALEKEHAAKMASVLQQMSLLPGPGGCAERFRRGAQ